MQPPELNDATNVSNDGWEYLLDQLIEDIPEIVDEFIAELGSAALYGQQTVSERELRTTASETFTLFAEQLAGSGDKQSIHRSAAQLGRIRAHQGVPLEALVDAVQLDFPILWRRLRSYANGELLDTLVDRVELLNRVVDQYSFAVRQEFLREQARIERDMSILTRQHLERLFKVATLTPSAVKDIAASLDIIEDQDFAVLVSDSQHARALQRITADPLAQGLGFGHPIGNSFCIFWRFEDAPNQLQRVLHESDLPGVLYRRVSGLEQVRTAARGALDLLATAGDISGIRAAENLIVPTLSSYAATLIPDFGNAERKRLESLSVTERVKLLETIHAYLSTGSVKQTAGQVFCHRNTVINRLRHFQDVTGLDVTVPMEAARAILIIGPTPTRGEKTHESTPI